MSDIHRCPTCHARHSRPSAWRLVRTLAVLVTAVLAGTQAALALSGPLSWALWLLVALGAAYVALIIIGMAAIYEEGAR